MLTVLAELGWIIILLPFLVFPLLIFLLHLIPKMSFFFKMATDSKMKTASIISPSILA